MPRRDAFLTIRTEGAILPPDVLRRIAGGDPDVPGLRSEDYGLAPGEKLNEAIARSWNRLSGLWRLFRAALDRLPHPTPRPPRRAAAGSCRCSMNCASVRSPSRTPS